MKTLDEVIDQLIDCHTNWARWSQTSDIVDRIAVEDALFYLKEYRDDKNDLTALRAYWAEQQANPALTWDELQKMEGKPVWIELHYKGCKPWSGWEIVDEVSNKWMTTHKDDYAREQMCEQWQAYRKERE